MTTNLPAILMLPPHGVSAVEQWMAEARLAAACDLVDRLGSTGMYDPIVLIAAEVQDAITLSELGAIAWDQGAGPFHFGQVLAGCLAAHQFNRVAYFGGASAPLLTETELFSLAERLMAADPMHALTNNLHSSDWFITNDVKAIVNFQESLPVDNPLGWVFSQEAGVHVISESPSAPTRLDIDTPMDLAMVEGHPALGPHLMAFLGSIPESIRQNVREIETLLATPGETLMVIGRASSHVWQQLERNTQLWIRMLVEERGMVASQRVARGEVQSIIASMIRVMGPKGFLEHLSEMSRGLVWDTRVWMAVEIGWPTASDRYAADLGLVDEIENESLRELTSVIGEADFPVLAGGYGVVSGGMYALLEKLALQTTSLPGTEPTPHTD